MADAHESLFGKLAVRKGLITLAQLDECATIQSCQKIPAPLELILIERGFIDEVALQELLNLAEKGDAALAEVDAAIESAEPESEVDRLDMRQDSLFGRLLVQRGMVSNEQVNASVGEQGRQAAEGKRVRLGKLLVAAGHLSMRQVLEVLEFMRHRLLYCEKCATQQEVVLELGNSYPCTVCGETLVTPLEICTIKASELFSADKPTAPKPATAKLKPAAPAVPKDPAQAGPKDKTAFLPVDGEKEKVDAEEEGEEDEQDGSGYRPVGTVEEVVPQRMPDPVPSAPAVPVARVSPEKRPMVVVGKGGGVRAVTSEVPIREARVWHYAVNRKVLGPVSAENLQGLVAEGKLCPDHLVWRKGMQEWQALSKIAELRPAPAAPAPLPAVLPSPSPGARGSHDPLTATVESKSQEELREKLRRAAGGDTMLMKKSSLKASMPPPKLEGYKLLEVIGKGGMGIVYKGYQESMDRVVAIKVMVPKYSENEEFIERFTREARASAKVNHPNIIQGIDVREVEGRWCFIMEYADGQRVGDVIRRGGAMSEARALKIVTEVGSALEHAHRNMIIHRDVKPDNIIVTKDGVAKLCDLGLVKLVSEDTENSKVGDLIGTPDYMSPEQASGKPDVDQRADIYCLGSAWYHMVTGSVPFKGENRTVVLMKHLTEPLEPADSRNPLVSRATASVIQKMLAKVREERYQTMAEAMRDLHLLAVGAPPSTAGPAAPERHAPAGPARAARPKMKMRRRRT